MSLSVVGLLPLGKSLTIEVDWRLKNLLFAMPLEWAYTSNIWSLRFHVTYWRSFDVAFLYCRSEHSLWRFQSRVILRYLTSLIRDFWADIVLVKLMGTQRFERDVRHRWLLQAVEEVNPGHITAFEVSLVPMGVMARQRNRLVEVFQMIILLICLVSLTSQLLWRKRYMVACLKRVRWLIWCLLGCMVSS
jgi:hypothetical protein